MLDLATDPRTRVAYKQARKRARKTRRTGGVDAPPAAGPAAHRLLLSLAPTEVVSWISWSRDHTPQRDGEWWLLALSAGSLFAVSHQGAERVFFAGEATHGSDFSTAHGAHDSGTRAATEVIAALKN